MAASEFVAWSRSHHPPSWLQRQALATYRASSCAAARCQRTQTWTTPWPCGKMDTLHLHRAGNNASLRKRGTGRWLPRRQLSFSQAKATTCTKRDCSQFQPRTAAIGSTRLPVTSCGLRLDDEAIRVAVGLRLGVNLCKPHTCPCGASVDATCTHGLSCKRSKGKMPRTNKSTTWCGGL